MMAFTFPEYIYFLVPTAYSREYTTMVFVQAHVSRTRRKSNVVAMIKLVVINSYYDDDDILLLGP